MSYWMTVEYLGAGFVLQRLTQRSGNPSTSHDRDKGGQYTPERVIHINDAENIDTSTIDHERLQSIVESE